MAWRLAKSLDVLRSQVNAAYPNRDKSNDGTIGDERHAATSSDHNPNSAGVVTAMDITNDPAHGVNARALAETLVASHDPRIKYLISNAQIVSSKVSPWVWRPYSGVNAHRHHVHVSVMGDPSLWDDTRPWAIGGAAQPQPRPPVTKRFTNIMATEFGGAGDEQPSAYADVKSGWPQRLGASLPFRFNGPRPLLRVYKGDKSVTCPIVDVGPWYPSARGPADPYWATGTRPRAETDARTNKAGIDLTPAAARAIGLSGKGLVDWEFVSGVAGVPVPKPTTLPGAKTGVAVTTVGGVWAAVAWFGANPIWAGVIGLAVALAIIGVIEWIKRK